MKQVVLKKLFFQLMEMTFIHTLNMSLAFIEFKEYQKRKLREEYIRQQLLLQCYQRLKKLTLKLKNQI